MSLYLEDDDELRKMRERFMQSAPAGAGVNPYGAPPRELDPRMLQSFLAQKAPEQRGGYPIPQREQGLGVADWFPLAAAGLDLAFNRGRGMGGIAQSAAGMAQHRDQLAAQQFEDDRGAYMRDQAARADAEQRGITNALNADNARMRQEGLDLERAQQRAVMERFIAANSPEAQAAELRLKQAQAAKAEADAKRDPFAITPYQQAQLDEMKRYHDISDRNADDSRQATADARKATLDATAAQREHTNTLKAQEVTRQAEQRSQKAAEAYSKQYEYELKALPALMAAQRLVDEIPQGGDIPGAGKWDSVKGSIPLIGAQLSSDKDLAMRSASEWMANLVQRAESGAAAPVPEALGYRIRQGSQPGATEREFKLGLAAATEYLRGSLRAGSYGREEAARGVVDLQSRGGGDFVFGALTPETPPPPAAPAAPEPAPIRLGGNRGAAGGGNNFQFSGPPAGDVLPVTNQKRSEVPRVDEYLQRLRKDDEDLGVVYR